MLDSFKRLFSRPGVDRGHEPVATWARRRGHEFKRTRDGAGFVIEGRLESRPWRLEWGPSQRAYIDGPELRFRMALELPPDQQMLLLSRSLMDTLERRTYEQFIDDVQTQTGSDTPEEMRWLVMFAKVELPPTRGLRLRFAAVASQPPTGLAWIEGPLAHLLVQEAESGSLRDDPPFTMMTLRGRLYLRLQLRAPDPEVIGAMLALFETAAARAVQVSGTVVDTEIGWSTSAASTWQSFQTDEVRDRRGKR